MADYYPLIARAVSNLGNNTGEARQALYERARTALVEQMRGRDPPASESEIMVEQRALAAAIHSVEDIAARLPRGGAKAVDRSPPNPNPIAERRPTPEPKKYKAANGIKTVGMTALGVACFAGTLLLSAGYVFGLAWVSIHVFEYLILAVPVAIVLCLFILLPLALFRKTRSVSVYGFFIFSFLFGATAWVLGFLTTLQYWGWVGVFIGLFLGFVGVVPLGIIASAFHSDGGRLWR